MRFFYHAVNGRGLGHLMRLSAVAHAASEMSETTHQMILTGSNYPEHLRRLDVSWMVLPHSNVIFDGNSKHRFRAVSARLLQTIIGGTAVAYNPDVIIFDTYVSPEVLKIARSTRAKIALIFRECRDSSFNGFYDRGFFAALDQMIIPHDEQEFLSGLGVEAQEKVSELKGIIEYVGPIVYPVRIDAERVEAMCQRLSIDETDTVLLITCGGGGFDFAAWNFLQSACTAARRLRPKAGAIKPFLVGGPLSRFAERFPGATYIPDLPDLQVLMARADLVVSHGGYNSVNEILRVGARAIIVPVHRRSEDQHARVTRLSQVGRVKCLLPEDSVDTFAACYEELLSSKRFAPVEFPGAKLAAANLVRLGGGYRIITDDDESLLPAFVERHADSERRIISRVSWEAIPRMIRKLEQIDVTPKQVWWEIGLGTSENPSLAKNTAHALDILHKVPPAQIFFWFLDLTGGTELKRLVGELSEFNFASLVAKIPAGLIESNARQRQEVLEELRQWKKRFTVDVISDSSNAVVCDQP